MNRADPGTGASSRGLAVYVLLSAALTVYVALCTGYRDHIWQADAWEHHRAIKAMTQTWTPPNPTYGTPEPTIRYSPFTAALTALCRATPIVPYTALSLSGVLSTMLLCAGVYALLKAYGHAAAAPAVLVVMVALWGGPPGYANSYALHDLPWHQVNPSAPGFAMALLVWAAFHWAAQRSVTAARIVLLALFLGFAGAFVMLSHAMTGVFMFLALFVLVVLEKPPARFRLVAAHLAGSGLAFVLCLLWPWYGFLDALGSSAQNDYWFNQRILTLVLTIWAPPAVLCVLFTLPLRKDPLVRFCLIGFGLMFVLSASQYVLKSPTLARQLIPAMVLAHVPIGVWLHERRALCPASWPALLKRAFSMDGAVAWPAICIVVATLVTLFCLAPQAYAVLKEPYLARVYVAGMLGKETKYLPLRDIYGRLLENVSTPEIVLSDPRTMWPVPSFNGYIVAAAHFEFFVPNQDERVADSERFFATDDPAGMLEILNKYGVDWVILNTMTMDDHVIARLGFEDAVAAVEEPLTLLDADDLRRKLASAAKTH